MLDPRNRLELYFDFISPNAYLAWTQIHRLAERHGRTVEPVPVLFAALLGQHDRPGPAEVPPMRAWMWRNCARKAALLGVPFRPPHSHPFNPLLALRIASLPVDAELRLRLIDRLFRAVWADGVEMADERALAPIVAEVGLDSIDAARSQEIKSKLRRATDDALSRGVFGVPTMIADGELFWGYDDFPYLERFLAGEDPLPRETMERWMSVRPSAVRR